jgi:lysophospholipase L1-like esterase
VTAFRKVLVVLATLLLCTAALEWWARSRAAAARTGILANRPIPSLYPTMENPEEIFSEVTPDLLEWTPYEHFVMKANLQGRFFRTNSLGLRGPETTLEKPAGRYRIAVLGGSSAWGYGCSSDQTTVPGVLETLLREVRPGQDIEVLNAGQAGYVSGQELTYFHRLISRFEPDLVILFDGYNDVFSGFTNAAAGWPQNTLRLRSRYEARWPARLWSELQEVSALARMLSRMFPADPPGKRPAAQDIAEAYVHNAKAIARLAAPARVLVALQPNIATISKPLAAEEAEMLRLRSEVFGDYQSYVTQAYEQMASLARDAGLEYVDLQGSLGAEPELLFADECHFGDKAARRIATAIEEYLAK